MNKTLIYSCVFLTEQYIDLINLLLKSFKLFGNSPNNVDYLILCYPNFQKKIRAIFNNLNINGKIWCLKIKTKFEATYSRLQIFDYRNINLYHKILYLDCDILVTHSINNILDFQLENKLYVVKEKPHRIHHCAMFTDKEYTLLDKKKTGFSSGILLFNNNKIIKDLFSKILLHIDNHISSKLPIPPCCVQPFVVYHATKNNLIDNQKLIDLVLNNPNIFKNQTIAHFPGGVGHYGRKINAMTNFMNNVMFKLNKNVNIETDNVFFPNLYTWNNSTIEFLENSRMNAFGPGSYKFINNYLVKCDFGGREHLLKFNENYSRFLSVRKGDFEVVLGNQSKISLDTKCEFGYELQLLIPYAYYLHKNNLLEKTTSCKFTNELYYFSKNHEQLHNLRISVMEIKNIPNPCPHVEELNYDKYIPPPYKLIYKNDFFVYDKPLLIIHNKFNDEWGMGPINFIDVDTLAKIFNLLNNKYTIIYIRPKSNYICEDRSSIKDLNESHLFQLYNIIDGFYH